MGQQGVIILAGDIGGTKTDLAVFSSEEGTDLPLAGATFPSGDFPDLESLVREFLSRNGSGMKVEHAVFGVAGPVIGGGATITNLPWTVDESTLGKALGISSVHLINDLLACACAVPSLRAGDLHTLNDGVPEPGGAKAVVAPGTGLGEAYLTWDGTRYQARSSEGGHTGFAPANDLETDLLRHLQRRFDHVSYERVCSGMGILNIFNYLKESGYAEGTGRVEELLDGVKDPVPVIIRSALDADSPCKLCLGTLNLFISILGAEAGNQALKVMASGGVYLGGGIPPRILPALQTGPFMDAFRRKGRMSELMDRIPVHVIMNPKAALLGAASYGMSLICKAKT
jgi:glucokinase